MLNQAVQHDVARDATPECGITYVADSLVEHGLVQMRDCVEGFFVGRLEGGNESLPLGIVGGIARWPVASLGLLCDAELQAAFEEVAKRFRGGKSGSNGKERGAAIAGQTSANPASDASSGTGEA